MAAGHKKILQFVTRSQMSFTFKQVDNRKKEIKNKYISKRDKRTLDRQAKETNILELRRIKSEKSERRFMTIKTS